MKQERIEQQLRRTPSPCAPPEEEPQFDYIRSNQVKKRAANLSTLARGARLDIQLDGKSA